MHHLAAVRPHWPVGRAGNLQCVKGQTARSGGTTVSLLTASHELALGRDAEWLTHLCLCGLVLWNVDSCAWSVFRIGASWLHGGHKSLW